MGHGYIFQCVCHEKEEWKNGCVHPHRSQVSVSGQLGELENLYALLSMSTLVAAAKEE